MSDTINVLNQILGIAAKRGEELGEADNAVENESDFFTLLEEISVIAGDCLEEHKAASLRAKPRKQRVYKEIVDQVNALVSDNDISAAEANYYTRIKLIQELLNRYNIEEGKI